MERLNTTIFNADTILHLHRYAIANDYVRGKIVLDIASGEGYGTNLLSNTASFVYGVDIDDKAVIGAREKYNKKNIEFIKGSTNKIPLKTNSVDVVVSFETIEHHDHHEKMMEEIQRVLTTNGIVIISTPDKYYYSDINNHKNKFHVKELYKTEFIDLIEAHFDGYQLLSQSYLNGNSLIFNQNTRDSIKLYSGNFLEVKKTFSHPDFLIAIISNSVFEKQENSIFDGESILAKNIITFETLKQVYDSNSYKLGHIILYPFKFLKKGLINIFK